MSGSKKLPDINPLSLAMPSNTIPINSILEKPDGAIQANLLFSLSIATLLFIIFCFFKPKLKGIYSPNLIGKRRKALPMVRMGSFSWIWTVLTISDEILLPLVGLDAYVFIQSLKMLFLIMCCLLVPAIVLLVPTFLLGRMKNVDQWYFKMSILNVKDSDWILWFPFLNCLVVEILVYYVIYVIYRNYVVLRQAFLRSPSTFHALNRFMELSDILGSKERTKKLLNLMTKTVILTGISAKYRESDIADLLQSTEIGKVSFVFKIKNREEMIIMLNKRNSCLVNLEIQLYEFYQRMIKLLKEDDGRNNNNNATITNELSSSSSPPSSAITDDLLIIESSNINLIEKIHLMHILISDPQALSSCRTIHINKDGASVDSIIHYYLKLQAIEEDLDNFLREFTSGQFGNAQDIYYDNKYDNKPGIDINPDIESSHQLELNNPAMVDDSDRLSSTSSTTDIMNREMSLISIRGLARVAHNIKDIKLTLYGTSESAIVIFDKVRSASIASQSLLSSVPFSFSARHAPGPSDLVWENLLIPPSEVFVRKTLANVLYIFTNIVFFSIVAGLGTIFNIGFLQSKFPVLIPIFEKSATLKNVIDGILAPLSYNLLLLGSPYLIQAMIKYQGTISKSELQCQLMKKYAWFLSIQSFLSVIVAKDLSDLLDSIFKGEYQDLLIKIKATMPQRSPFFFNLVIQRATIGMMVQLAKPGRLIMAAINRIRHTHWTPRDAQESRKPDVARLGFMYPDYLIIIFQMTLAFMSLTPLSILAGLLFYGMACFTFRALFIYTIKVHHESGGIFWRKLATQLMIAVVLNHFFTLIQLVFKEATYQAVLLAPFFFSSIILMYYFDDFFSKRISNPSLVNEGGDKLLAFIDKIDLKREEMMTKSIHPDEGGERDKEERNFSDTTISIENDQNQGQGQEDEKTNNNKSSRETVKKYKKFYDSVPCNLGIDIEMNFDRLESVELRDTDKFDGLHYVEPSDNPYCNPILFKKFSRIMLPPYFFAVLKRLLNSNNNNNNNSDNNINTTTNNNNNGGGSNNNNNDRQ